MITRRRSSMESSRAAALGAASLQKDKSSEASRATALGATSPKKDKASEPSKAAALGAASPQQDKAAAPHINQLRPRGADKSYVNGAYHCGPAVVAMVARGWGRMKDLSDAKLIQGLAQGITTRKGTDPEGLTRMLERVNVPPGGPALGAGYPEQSVRDHLQQGRMLIAQVRSSDPRTRQDSAHYVLVRGMTPRGNYIISDPLKEGPSVVSPRQLREAALKAPPDGGMLIPIAKPGEGAAAGQARQASLVDSMKPAAENPDPKAFTATEDVFEGVDTSFRTNTRGAANSIMRENEQRHSFKLDVSYRGGGSPQGARAQPVAPKDQDVGEFAEHVLELKERGNMKAYHLLGQLEASSSGKDAQVLSLIEQMDKKDPGTGKKMMGEAF